MILHYILCNKILYIYKKINITPNKFTIYVNCRDTIIQFNHNKKLNAA